MPVAVFYDPAAEALVIGANSAFGEGVMTTSKKFRDAQRQPKVAVVVDDPSPRVLEVRGHAETHLDGGADVGQRVGLPLSSLQRGCSSGRTASWPWASTAQRSRGPHGTSREPYVG